MMFYWLNVHNKHYTDILILRLHVALGGSAIITEIGFDFLLLLLALLASNKASVLWTDLLHIPCTHGSLVAIYI